MKIFSKEQLEILKPNEEQFKRAVYFKYYRSTNTKLLDELKTIYDSVADEPYNANWGCGHCVLAFLAALGKIYFESKAALENQAQSITSTVTAMTEAVSNATKSVKSLNKATPRKASNNKKKTTKK